MTSPRRQVQEPPQLPSKPPVPKGSPGSGNEGLMSGGGQIPRPDGVDPSFHLLWTHPELAKDLHLFFGPTGHVIPHGFAPIHKKLAGDKNRVPPLQQPIDNGAVGAPDLPPNSKDVAGGG